MNWFAADVWGVNTNFEFLFFTISQKRDIILMLKKRELFIFFVPFDSFVVIVWFLFVCIESESKDRNWTGENVINNKFYCIFGKFSCSFLFLFFGNSIFSMLCVLASSWNFYRSVKIEINQVKKTMVDIEKNFCFYVLLFPWNKQIVCSLCVPCVACDWDVSILIWNDKKKCSWCLNQEWGKRTNVIRLLVGKFCIIFHFWKR